MAYINILHSVYQMEDKEALAQGRIIHLGNLNFQATKKQFANKLFNLGFDDLILYWPDSNALDAKLIHPFCRLQFKDSTTAEHAKLELSGAKLLGRPMILGTVGGGPAISTARIPKVFEGYTSSNQSSFPKEEDLGESDNEVGGVALGNVAETEEEVSVEAARKGLWLCSDLP
jgi:hypothetical protein